jgi:hypothetical protein
MANLFFRGEQAPKQEAINALVLKISEYFAGRYEVRSASDDGGAHLEVQVEVSTPNDRLSDQAPEFPFAEIVPKWMGWRVVVAKVPIGYIDAITNRSDNDY